MKTDLATDRGRDAHDSAEQVTDSPTWFHRVFTGDGTPPELPDEPGHRRWRPSGDLRSVVYFLLGLCCGLLAAYLVYHAGGRS